MVPFFTFPFNLKDGFQGGWFSWVRSGTCCWLPSLAAQWGGEARAESNWCFHSSDVVMLIVGQPGDDSEDGVSVERKVQVLLQLLRCPHNCI